MKKGSMELGVNSIVVLIIAMAVLGLIIYFIYDKLSNPDIPEPPVGEPRAPSYTEPITFVTSAGIGGIIGKPGEQLSAKVAVLNTDSSASMGNAVLTLDCSGTTGASISSSPHTIEAGRTYTYTTIITMPTGLAQKYVCNLKASGESGPEMSQDVFVEIK